MNTITFFLVVFLLSIPFWILGAIAPDFTEIFPIRLPISALMTFCPLIAAVMLTYKKLQGQGVTNLLRLTFDVKKIRNKRWYLLTLFLMPAIAVISYYYAKFTGVVFPKIHTPFLYIPFFFILYFVGAIGEEIGWSGYAINPLQNRVGALKASIILGFVWAIWHIIPWSQTHHDAVWIVWQLISTVFLRLIMVWLFNNTGRSVFVMILFHTMINISPYVIPNQGAYYDPFLTCLLTALVVLILFFFRNPKNSNLPRIGLVIGVKTTEKRNTDYET